MKTYLIVSESYKLLDEQVNKIICDSLNVIKYDLRVDSLTDVINEANYFSLTNEDKYIVVKCGNLFKAGKKEDSEDTSSKDLKILEEYLKNPSDKSTIIFVTSEIPDKRKKVYKQIESSGGVILIPSLNKKDLTYKCMELLKNKGYKPTYESASFIVENSYVNYDIMTNELEKVYSLIKENELDINTLKNVVSEPLNDNVFNFINAIIHRDLETATLASKDFETLKIEPSMVLIMLAKEFQILYILKRGAALQSVQNFLRKDDWQMKSYLENVSLYTENELKKIIIKLNDYDYKLKCGLLDRSVLLDLLSFDFCE